MGLWVLLLIRYSTFTFLSDVGHITHICIQHSPSSVSPSIHRHCLYRRCCFLRNGPTASVLPFVKGGLWYHCWITGELGGPSISRLEQPHKWERHHTLTQNLKANEFMGPLICKVFNIYIRCETYNSHLHTTIIDAGFWLQNRFSNILIAELYYWSLFLF